MTFPNSGAVSIDAFVTHVDDPGITTDGDTRPHSMSEFYRKTDGPVYDLETTENDDVPASGEIKFSQLRGTRAVVTRSVSSGIFITGSNQFGHVLDHYFNSAERTNKACRLIVDQDLYPGQTIANADPNNNTTTVIPSSSQPHASDFPHGLYLQFPQNSNGNNTNYIGGAHGAHGNPGTFPNDSSQNANNPNDGGTGGPGFEAACKVYVNPGSMKPNDNTNSCFRGGGGGGGGGAIFNRGNRGNVGLWNPPNNGAPLRYKFGTSNIPIANLSINAYGTRGSGSYNFTWNFQNVSGYREGTVAIYKGTPNTGNHQPYSTPTGAPSGGLIGHGYPGSTGSNSANWTANTKPNEGSAGAIQVWNSGNPINDIYNTAGGGALGNSGSSNPWAYFPNGSAIRYFSNSNNVGLTISSNYSFALGVSAHYGYPIVKILYRVNGPFGSAPGMWYHQANLVGGQNNSPVGSHFHVLNNAQASNPGTQYQFATPVDSTNIPNLTGTIRPAGTGGSNGVQFNTAGNGAINSGDVTSVE